MKSNNAFQFKKLRLAVLFLIVIGLGLSGCMLHTEKSLTDYSEEYYMCIFLHHEEAGYFHFAQENHKCLNTYTLLLGNDEVDYLVCPEMGKIYCQEFEKNEYAHETTEDLCLIRGYDAYDIHEIEYFDTHRYNRVDEHIMEIIEFLVTFGCLSCTALNYTCCFGVKYAPHMNRYIDGSFFYGFVIDFTSMSIINGLGLAYAWISPSTKEWVYEIFAYSFREWVFEEYGFSLTYGRNYYANIPDAMFPIPMLDGAVIPYDRFHPPSGMSGVGFSFYDMSVYEIYTAQLRDAGFTEIVGRWDYHRIWSYERDSDGATLMIEMFFHYRFTIDMAVYFLRPLRVQTVQPVAPLPWGVIMLRYSQAKQPKMQLPMLVYMFHY